MLRDHFQTLRDTIAECTIRLLLSLRVRRSYLRIQHFVETSLKYVNKKQVNLWLYHIELGSMPLFRSQARKKKAKSLAAVIAQDIEFCILSQQKKRNKTKHVLRPRIELGTSCVWGTRDNQLHHPSTWIWNCSGRIMLLIINLSLPQYWSFWHFDQPYWRAIAPQKS